MARTHDKRSDWGPETIRLRGSEEITYDGQRFLWVLRFSWFAFAACALPALAFAVIAARTGEWGWLVATGIFAAGVPIQLYTRNSFWEMQLESETVTICTRAGIAVFRRPILIDYYQSGEDSMFLLERTDCYVVLFCGPSYLLQKHLPEFLRRAGVPYCVLKKARIHPDRIASLKEYMQYETQHCAH